MDKTIGNLARAHKIIDEPWKPAKDNCKRKLNGSKPYKPCLQTGFRAQILIKTQFSYYYLLLVIR